MILSGHLVNWHRIDQSLDAGEDGDEGEAPSGDIEASGAIAGETIPMREPTKAPLNGLITNDKFCLTRAGRLRLSWPRARVRSLPPAYSSGEVIHRGGEHAAAAHLARPAHRRSDGDRPAALGSGLPAPPAMGDDESIRAG